MDYLQEPLIAPRRPNNSWRSNFKIIILISAMIICTLIYLYLNFQVNKTDEILATESFKPLSRRKPILNHDSGFETGSTLLSINEILSYCLVALQLAGRKVVNSSLLKNHKLEHVGSKGFTKEGVNDIVTGVDIESSKIITSILKDAYPRIRVVSEEDATKNFRDIHDKQKLSVDRVELARLIREAKLEVESSARIRDTLLPQKDLMIWIDPLDATKEYSENLTEYVTLMACVVHQKRPIAGIILKPFENKVYWSLEDESSRKAKLSSHLHEIYKNFRASEDRDDVRVIVSRSHTGDVSKMSRDNSGTRYSLIKAGGSGYKTIELVGGFVDAYVHVTHIKKWDVCAPQAILYALGGSMTTLSGLDINFDDAQDHVITDGLIATFNSKIHNDLIKYMAQT